MIGVWAFLARIIISFALVFFLTVKFELCDNILMFCFLWIFFYTIASIYFHIRRNLKEDEEERDRKLYRAGYRYKYEDASSPLLDLFFNYILFPLGGTAIVFVVVPSLLQKFLPDKVATVLQIIYVILVIIGIIVYDVRRAMDGYSSFKNEKERKAHIGKKVDVSETDDEEYTLLEEADDSVPKQDIETNLGEDSRIISTYIEFCREKNIPDEILELMNRPGLTLDVCMQIKAGYEDGLCYEDMKKYAKPGFTKSQCEDIRRKLYEKCGL